MKMKTMSKSLPIVAILALSSNAYGQEKEREKTVAENSHPRSNRRSEFVLNLIRTGSSPFCSVIERLAESPGDPKPWMGRIDN